MRLDNQRLGVTHRNKPVFVQAFVAEPTVEALDIGILHRLARSNERERNACLVGPRIQHLTSELRTVVARDQRARKRKHRGGRST